MKWTYVALAIVLASACQKGAENRHKSQDMSTDMQVNDNNVEQDGQLPPPPVPQSPTQAQTTGVSYAPKIIKTGHVSLELNHYDSFNTAIHHVLSNFGAYIASEQQISTDAQITNEMTVRVPVEQFENLMTYLTADKKNRVVQKQINSADVSAEYADIQARLETRKQMRARYMAFLSEAKKMEDVLRLQSEINAITEEIEAAAGRVKYLSHQTLYSTIHLRFFQVIDANKVDQPPGFASRLIDAFRGGAAAIASVLIALVYLWPLLVGAVVSLWLARRYKSGLLRISNSGKGRG